MFEVLEKNFSPFFSVIVPTYNNEKEIKKCVDSILEQYYTDFEVILVDDGSTDMTSLLCDKLADLDNRIRVIHKKNEGTAAARNSGLFLARGKYVYFVDADDWIDQKLLWEAAKILDVTEAPDIFTFGLEMIMEDGRSVQYPCFFTQGLYSKIRLENEVYPRMMVPRGKGAWMPSVSGYLCDKIILRELMVRHYCRDTTLFMGEESVCAYECIYNARNVFFSSLILYYYNRMSTSSMHRRYHEDLFENNIRLAQYYRESLGNGNPVMERQINMRECKSLWYVIEHELEFKASVRQSSSHLSNKIKRIKRCPICPLKGLRFFDKCFIIVLSFRMQYFILLSKKMIGKLVCFKKRFMSIIENEKQ